MIPAPIDDAFMIGKKDIVDTSNVPEIERINPLPKVATMQEKKEPRSILFRNFGDSVVVIIKERHFLITRGRNVSILANVFGPDMAFILKGPRGEILKSSTVKGADTMNSDRYTISLKVTSTDDVVKLMVVLGPVPDNAPKKPDVIIVPPILTPENRLILKGHPTQTPEYVKAKIEYRKLLTIYKQKKVDLENKKGTQEAVDTAEKALKDARAKLSRETKKHSEKLKNYNEQKKKIKESAHIPEEAKKAVPREKRKQPLLKKRNIKNDKVNRENKNKWKAHMRARMQKAA